MIHHSSICIHIRVEVAHDHNDDITEGLVVNSSQKVISVILYIYRRLYGRSAELYKCYIPDFDAESSGDYSL